MDSQIKKLEAIPLTVHNCLLGESPVWDHHNGAILWIDILKGEIHEYIQDKNLHRTLSVGERIGSVALCKDGNLLAAVQSGLALVNRQSGQLKLISSPEKDQDTRFNDGKTDPAGRFYAGTMSLSRQEGRGSFYMLESKGRVTKLLTGLSIPNGMAWSMDRRVFYHIDTPTSEVCAYHYDIRTGTLSGKRVVLTIPPAEGLPDGMTIDTEGMLWIAHWNGAQISRWDPHSGRKLLSVPLPVSKVTSCTFGGENMNDIYITSAMTTLTDEQLKEQPFAGALFIIKDSGFQGLPSFEFGGP